MRDEARVRTTESDFIQSMFINSVKEDSKGTRRLTPQEIDRLIIGVMGEAVSKLQMGVMETVVNGAVEDVQIVSQKEIPGLNLVEGTKGEILTKALRKGLEESSLDNVAKGEYVAGLGSWADRKKENKWSLQKEVVIPDGWLLNREKKLKGFMDVKAYSNEEIRAIVEGKEVEGEAVSRDRFFEAIDGMVNMYVVVQRQLREVKSDEGTLDTVLRFPKDADETLLRQLAEVMNKEFWGDESWQLNLTIQRLPLTRQEMLEKGKEVLKEQWETVEESKLSDRNKGVMRKYLGLDKMETVQKEEEKDVEARSKALRGAIEAWRRGDKEEMEKLLSQSRG